MPGIREPRSRAVNDADISAKHTSRAVMLADGRTKSDHDELFPVIEQRSL
jgi:hypothetical protein